jgi:hypothetical protein
MPNELRERVVNAVESGASRRVGTGQMTIGIGWREFISADKSPTHRRLNGQSHTQHPIAGTFAEGWRPRPSGMRRSGRG